MGVDTSRVGQGASVVPAETEARAASAAWAGLLFEWLFGTTHESILSRSVLRAPSARYVELRVGDQRSRVMVYTTVDEPFDAWAQRLERARRLQLWALRGDCALTPDLRTAQPPMMGEWGVVVAQGAYGFVAVEVTGAGVPSWRLRPGDAATARVQLAAPAHVGVVSVVPSGDDGRGLDAYVDPAVGAPGSEPLRAQMIARDGRLYAVPHRVAPEGVAVRLPDDTRMGTVAMRVRGCVWLPRGRGSSPAWLLDLAGDWETTHGSSGRWVSDGRRLALFFDALDPP